MSDNAGNTATKIRTVTVLKGDYNLAKGVNYPKLALGMTPIKWDGSTWINTTENDPDWYDYSTKKWANAKTADGSYWVWIPRYIYKISSGWHSSTVGTIEVQFSKGTNDNWNSSSIGNIDTGTGSSASRNKWTNHPAFTFGSDQLEGFWAAKFIATAAEGLTNKNQVYSCQNGDDVTTKRIKIVPNVDPWICISIGNAFTVTRNMETNSAYGWGTSGNGIDTHLMKNVEWGAIMYLSKSVYGKEVEQIAINYNYLTGCANVFLADTYGQSRGLCEYAFQNAVKASTTGTIYGVYDMNYYQRESVAAYIDAEGINLGSDAILNAPSKYKDVYRGVWNSGDDIDHEYQNYNYFTSYKGDALYETSVKEHKVYSYSWFNAKNDVPYSYAAWFTRGGNTWPVGNRSYNGGFNFSKRESRALSEIVFRPVLLVGEGL